ncbi:MAG: arginine deiminase-related protein [Flammeovirgaceae bacterium]|nr:arginine deiminase-related protein [Flammeovirgaceae bacterium]
MPSIQAPRAVMMIRPAAFGFNSQTAGSNAFQSEVLDVTNVSSKAIDEFDRMVAKLEAHDIDVIIIQDTPIPEKPDAIFPNNWISFQPDGSIVLYPMMAENRRWEVRKDIVEQIEKKFSVTKVIDLSGSANTNIFLEGTGSVVFDHVNKIAYANRSPRTHEQLLRHLCEKISYRYLLFDAVDEKGTSIYHTNVVMCIGATFVTICLDAIKNDEDQEALLERFSQTGHKVVAISYAQMNAFAGNMLEVQTKSGDPVVLLSEKAYQTLLPGQIDVISKHADLIPLTIETIEKVGGGSVRCMVAGIHLQALSK